MPASDQEKVLSLKMEVKDRATKAIAIVRRNIARFRRLGVAAFKKVAAAAAALGRTVRTALLGPFTLLAGALSGVGFVKLIQGTAEAGDEAAKTAAKLGLTVEALQEMDFAFERTGVGADTGRLGVQRMTRRIAEAAQGAGEARAAIRELGLDAESLSRLSADQQLLEIADALQSVENQTHRVRLGFKLFDSEGVAIINTLAGGRDEIVKLREEARRLGGVIDSEGARRSEAFQDAMTNLRFALKGVRNAIALELIPVFTQWVTGLADWIASNREGLRENATEWANWVKRVGFAVKFGVQSVRAFRKAFSELLSNPDEAGNLTEFLSRVSTLVSDVTTEVITVVSKLILRGLKVLIAPVLSLFDALGSKSAKAFMGQILKAIGDLPFDIVSRFNEALGAVNERGGFGAKVLGFLGLDNTDAIDAGLAAAQITLRTGIDSVFGRVTDSIEDGEQVIGAAIQNIGKRVSDEVSGIGGDLETSVSAAIAKFNDFENSLEQLAPTSEPIANLLASLRLAKGEYDKNVASIGNVIEKQEELKKAVVSFGAVATQVATAGGGDGGALARLREILSSDLIRESDARLIGGVQKTTLLLELEFDKRVRDYQRQVDEQRITQEAFNRWRLAEEQELLRKIKQINGTAVDGVKQAFREARDQFKSNFEAGREFAQSAISLITDTGTQLLGSVIDRAKNTRDIVRDSVKNMINIVGQLLSKLAANAVLNAFLPAGGAGGAAAVLGLVAAANGAVAAGGLNEIQGFAKGGVSNAGTVAAPTLFVAGEGKKREAIVPLPDGRAIPAVVTDDGGGASGDVNVFIEIRAFDARGVDEVLVKHAPTIEGIFNRAAGGGNSETRAVIRSVNS